MSSVPAMMDDVVGIATGRRWKKKKKREHNLVIAL